MISGKFLLDTNYVIRLMAGRKLIDERLSSDPDLYLSIIVLGEIYYRRKNRNGYRKTWLKSPIS
jgi:predicted nucleic acid-binding protein